MSPERSGASHFGGILRRLRGILLGSVEFEKFFLIVIHWDRS